MRTPTPSPTPAREKLMYINSQGYDLNFQAHLGSCFTDKTTGIVTNPGCTTSGAVPLHTPNDIEIFNGYAYITNAKNSGDDTDTNFSDIVVRCEITSTNTFKNCVDSNATNSGTLGSGFTIPEGITIHNGFSYVANGGYKTVALCTVDASTHDLTNCRDSMDTSGVITLDAPTKVAFSTLGPNDYIYIVNSSSNTVTMCKQVDTATGVIKTSSCIDLHLAAVLDNPWGITFYTPPAVGSSTYAYITNQGNNTVTMCEKQGDGTFAAGDCTTTGSTFTTPRGISSSGSTMYIANSGDTSITSCKIHALLGTLSGCGAIDGSPLLSSPSGLAISNGFVYIADNSLNKVTRFGITGSTFVDSGAGLLIGAQAPYGIAFAQKSGGNGDFSYIANPNSTISGILYCQLNSTTGIMTDCADSSFFGTFPAVGLASSNGYVYATSDTDPAKMRFCKINQTTGNFSSCATPSNIGSLNGPYGILINSGVAYITNYNSNTISKCTISSSNGDFSACSNAGATSINVPTGIAMNGNFAYISNSLPTDSITVCSVNSSGNLSGCAASTAAAGLLLNPSSLAVNNNFLYVANIGIADSNPSVTKCAISATNGQLTGCTNTVGIINNLKRAAFDVKFY